MEVLGEVDLRNCVIRARRVLLLVLLRYVLMGRLVLLALSLIVVLVISLCYLGIFQIIKVHNRRTLKTGVLLLNRLTPCRVRLLKIVVPGCCVSPMLHKWVFDEVVLPEIWSHVSNKNNVFE